MALAAVKSLWLITTLKMTKAFPYFKFLIRLQKNPLNPYLSDLQLDGLFY